MGFIFGVLLSLISFNSYAVSDAPKLSSLYAKANQACVIKDGAVRCWGKNWTENIPSSLALGAKSVQVGVHHACGLNASAEIVCWAEPGYDFLAYVPPGVIGVNSIAVGDTHTCAEMTSQIKCWGTLDIQIARPKDFSSMLAGNSFVCLHYGSKVECMGEPGLTPSVGADVAVSVQRIFLMGDRWTYQNVSGVCIADLNNKLHCYSGSSSYVAGESLDGAVTSFVQGSEYECYVKNGQLNCREFGHYPNLDREKVIARIPQDVKDSKVIQNFVVGDGFACVQLPTRVRCWGKNIFDQASPPPDLVEAKSGTFSSWNDVCVIGSVGDLSCYTNRDGYGSKSMAWPDQIANISNVKAVEFSTSASFEVCAVAGVENRLICWLGTSLSLKNLPASIPGEFKKLINGHLQCMLIDNRLHCQRDYSGLYSKLESLGAFDDVLDASSNSFGICVLKEDKSLKCAHSYRVENYDESLSVEKLFMSGSTACVITTEQSVKCWGDKHYGAINAPEDLSHVEHIKLSNRYKGQPEKACAQTKNGQQVCWSAKL